ncbi:MAG: DUF3617 domain-containing protein [Thermodesulfovibrionales bacterium]
MKKTSGLVFVLATIILWTAAAFAEPNMQEGKWEITSKVEMKGMPMEMPAVKTTTCLNHKDAVPQKSEKNQDCKMISNKIEGSTVTWVMQCRDKKGNTIDSSGRITYKGASFDGAVEMDMSGKEGKQHMSQKMSGKRIGDCTK